MKLSDVAEKELVELGKSEELRKDMAMLRSQWQEPFTKDGFVDVDAFLEFLQQFNEFINHEPRQFKKIEDKNMKL